MTDSRRISFPLGILCRAGFVWLCSWSALSLQAAEPSAGGEFVNHVYRDAQGTHKYVVFVPHGYTDQKSWPAMLWLHGASARGRDGRTPLVSGLGPNIHQRRETIPFLAVFPQCENLESRLLGGWTDDADDADRALRILKDVEQHYRVDPKRRILAGVSMGAFGVWSLASRTPEMWSALIPISGGGPVSLTETLKGIPVWAFHAADDQVVPPSASVTLVEALKTSGSPAWFTELPNGGHNIGSRVFEKDEIYSWLMNPKQPPAQPADWTVRSNTVGQLQNENPFVPGAEMDRAVRVHVGTDILAALAHGIPKQVPADALNGSRGPQSQRTESGWTSFQVTAAGVQYSGQVTAARLEPLPDNQLRLRIGIQPLTMTILGTEIQGRMLRAQAGPMQAVIGVRRPAWLNITVKPRIESRQLKLELVGADFVIEPDNWYVTEPNGVEVFPLPMLRDRISQRLTDGLYAKQHEIQQQVVAGVPKLLEQVEQQTAARFNQVVTFGRWPMPVWQPRAKFWLSEFAIAENGLSITLGVTLAALAPPSDTIPIQKFSGPEATPALPTHGVQIAVAKDVVEVWSGLLAASGVRSFHVQDFHAEAFQKLGDREFLSRAMTGLIDPRGDTEIRSVLSFEQPISILTVDSDRPDPSTARLAGRELRLTISEREAGESVWTPRAEFPLSWQQDFRVSTRKLGHRSRQIELKSLSSPHVESTGRVFREVKNSRERLYPDLVAEQFRRGWDETFAAALGREIQMPERVIAEVPLVCDDFGLYDPFLVIRLSKPTTQLRNLSQEPVTYDIRSDGSDWSQPLTLAPGMMHEYRAFSPLTWRCRLEGRELNYTLPVGSVSHYRGGERPLTLAPEGAAPPVAASPDVLNR